MPWGSQVELTEPDENGTFRCYSAVIQCSFCKFFRCRKPLWQETGKRGESSLTWKENATQDKLQTFESQRGSPPPSCIKWWHQTWRRTQGFPAFMILLKKDAYLLEVLLWATKDSKKSAEIGKASFSTKQPTVLIWCWHPLSTSSPFFFKSENQ